VQISPVSCHEVGTAVVVLKNGMDLLNSELGSFNETCVMSTHDGNECLVQMLKGSLI
jgi:hypothetical protein